jgi:hypothetical protein
LKITDNTPEDMLPPFLQDAPGDWERRYRQAEALRKQEAAKALEEERNKDVTRISDIVQRCKDLAAKARESGGRG